MTLSMIALLIWLCSLASTVFFHTFFLYLFTEFSMDKKYSFKRLLMMSFVSAVIAVIGGSSVGLILSHIYLPV